jgi:hypothetical protein
MPLRAKKIGSIVLFALIGAGVGYFVGKLLPKPTGPREPLGWWFIPLLVLMPWLAIAWHELGHVIGGWLSGFRLVLFTAGPLRIDRQGERLRMSWNRTPSLWGGVAATTPSPGETSDMRRKMMTMVAGGPLASLLGGLLLLAAFWLRAGEGPLRLALLVGGAVSLTIALATLLPFSSGGFVNDGQRILQLLRGGESVERWIAGANLSAWSMTTRARQWPEDLVRAHSDGAPATFDGVLARWMRHSWHADRGEIAEAGQWLDEALAQREILPSSVRPIVDATAAEFHARHTGDAERAGRHWSQVGRASMLPAHALALTEAAVMAAQGRREEARGAAERARRGVRHLHGSVREQAEETLAWVEQRLLHG